MATSFVDIAGQVAGLIKPKGTYLSPQIIQGAYASPQGEMIAVNPKTGQPEVVYEINEWDESGGAEGTGAPALHYYFKEDAPAGATPAPWNFAQSSGLGSIGDLATLGLGSAAFGVGGATGASPFTGMDTQDALMLDAAGLATGIGLGGSGVLDAGLAAGGGAAATGGGALAGAGDMFGAGAVYDAGVGGLSIGGAAGGTAPIVSNLAPSAGAFNPMTGAPLAAGGTSSFMSGLTGISPGALSALGVGAATGLGLYGINQQTGVLENMANQENARFQQLFNAGAPYRDQLAGTFQPGFNVSQIPGYNEALDTATQSLLRQASTGGNPFGNPGVLAEINKYTTGNLALPTLFNYRNQLGNFGGLSQFAGGAAQGPNLGPQVAGIQSQGNAYNVLGAGIANLTQPRYSFNPFSL